MIFENKLFNIILKLIGKNGVNTSSCNATRIAKHILTVEKCENYNIDKDLQLLTAVFGLYYMPFDYNDNIFRECFLYAANKWKQCIFHSVNDGDDEEIYSNDLVYPNATIRQVDGTQCTYCDGISKLLALCFMYNESDVDDNNNNSSSCINYIQRLNKICAIPEYEN